MKAGTVVAARRILSPEERAEIHRIDEYLETEKQDQNVWISKVLTRLREHCTENSIDYLNEPYFPTYKAFQELVYRPGIYATSPPTTDEEYTDTWED